MEQQVEALSKMVFWGLGTCVTGFLFLMGWIIKLQIEVTNRVSFKWIEEKFEKDLREEMKTVTMVLTEIKDAVVGNMDKPGIISRLRDVERDVAVLKGHE